MNPLHALVELAEGLGLTEDPATIERPVPFVIVLRPDGTYVELETRYDDRGRARPMRAPVLPRGRTSQTVAAFLVDGPQYVLGLEKSETTKHAARAVACHASFAALVQEAWTATRDLGVRAVGRFLAEGNPERVLAAGRGPTRAKAELAPPWSWTGAEMLAFRLEGDTACVHERPAVAAWWRARYAAQQGTVELCLITGERLPCVQLHPPIKRVPGANAAGAPLLTFNAPIVESWGRTQGANAPISEHAANAYARALNWLLERQDAEAHRSGVRLGDDAVCVWWSRPNTAGMAFARALARILEGPPPAPKGTAPPDVPWAYTTSLLPAEGDENLPLYGLILVGAQGRISVREAWESTVADVKQHFRAWQATLGGTDARPISLYALRTSLQRQDKAGPSVALMVRLLRAALLGGPLPRGLFTEALELALHAEEGDGEGGVAQRVRLALLRAALANPAWMEAQEGSVMLDERCNEVPYLLGRLFWLLQSLQYRAIPAPNRGIRQKYFRVAAAQPASTFAHLLTMATHHAKKLGEGSDRDISALCARLPVEGLPARLNPLEQSRFLVGYHQQREDWFRRVAEAKARRAAKAGDTSAAKPPIASEEQHG